MNMVVSGMPDYLMFLHYQIYFHCETIVCSLSILSCEHDIVRSRVSRNKQCMFLVCVDRDFVLLRGLA